MTQEEIRAIPAAAVKISKHLDRLRYLKQKSTSVPAMQTSERVQTSAIDRSMVLSDSIIDLEREVAGERKELDQMIVQRDVTKRARFGGPFSFLAEIYECDII